MSTRDSYPAGVPNWVASVQPDPAAAVAFYTALFGWEATNLMPDDHPGDYHVCRLRGREVAAIVSVHGAPAPSRAVWTTHVRVDSADAAAAKAQTAGGTVVGPPFDSPGGGRVAILADPAGAVFAAWETNGRIGAQVVNEPGAWAMSAVHAPDPEAAEAFYGDLFGWHRDAFAPNVSMLRLPGYVGGEPQQPVPRDVVAAMVEASEPAAWSVDFWIDDADAAAARTPGLGGAVLAAPHDMPPFRRAVLADPAGAAFSVSSFA